MTSLKTIVPALVLVGTIFSSAWGETDPQRRSLPLLAQDFEKYGYEAPLPFGASLGVMLVSQEFKMDNISLGGQPAEVFAISSARSANSMLMPKLDMWLLPFLDVYAFGGFMSGTMNIDVSLFDFPLLGDIRLPLEFDFEGALLGGGMTLAGGYGPVFAMVDGSYSVADMSSFESKLDMVMASGRLGVATGEEGQRAMFWLGGMLQDLDQTLEQMVPVGDTGQMTLVSVDVGVKDPWNMVMGTRLQAGRRLGLMVEAGFLGRRYLFGNLEYRF